MSAADRRRDVDARSGRPLDGGGEAFETLSDDELEEELTVAAYAPGLLRINRYQRLLGERQRRRTVFT